MIVSLKIYVCAWLGQDGLLTTSDELRTCKTSVPCCWDLDSRYVLPVVEFGVCARKIQL